jgi:pimeloyl-ACP methyl ester carboxylesterase
MHVEVLPSAPGAGRKLPVVMIHGGFHTGDCYLRTPDGRPGWAPVFARHGHTVFVPDWPCRGRSPGAEALVSLSSLDVARSMSALLREVGPAVVLAHSAGGPLAWWLAEHCSDQVAAIVAVAPGPPANLMEPLPDDPQLIAAMGSDAGKGCPVYSNLDRPVRVDADFIAAFWANSPRFPHGALQAYASSIVAESPRILNERFNIGGHGLRITDPVLIGRRPILVMTGEHDARHPREVDQAVAEHFGAEFDWLPARGVRGNGHMLMAEDNSEQLATDVVHWLSARLS